MKRNFIFRGCERAEESKETGIKPTNPNVKVRVEEHVLGQHFDSPYISFTCSINTAISYSVTNEIGLVELQERTPRVLVMDLKQYMFDNGLVVYHYKNQIANIKDKKAQNYAQRDEEVIIMPRKYLPPMYLTHEYYVLQLSQQKHKQLSDIGFTEKSVGDDYFIRYDVCEKFSQRDKYYLLVEKDIIIQKRYEDQIDGNTIIMTMSKPKPKKKPQILLKFELGYLSIDVEKESKKQMKQTAVVPAMMMVPQPMIFGYFLQQQQLL